jgi:Nucleotidyl transferase AbiEii toxin, Type IV TA system
MSNTRMKDLYDLWKLSQDFDFDGALLTDAIKVKQWRYSKVPQKEFDTLQPSRLSDLGAFAPTLFDHPSMR